MLMATTNQAYIFLSAIYMGIVIGIIYDIYRVVRILSNPSKAVTSIIDILFWVTATIVSIVGFFYVSSGEIRLYNIIGLALGWAIYLLSISRFVIKFLKWLYRGIAIIWINIIKVLAYPFQLFIDMLKIPKNIWIKFNTKSKER